MYRISTRFWLDVRRVMFPHSSPRSLFDTYSLVELTESCRVLGRVAPALSWLLQSLSVLRAQGPALSHCRWRPQAPIAWRPSCPDPWPSMCIPGGPGCLRYTAERPRRPRASYAMPSAQHMFAFTHLALSNNQLTGGQNTYLAARLFWLMSFLNAIDSINRFLCHC